MSQAANWQLLQSNENSIGLFNDTKVDTKVKLLLLLLLFAFFMCCFELIFIKKHADETMLL